jgi:hypothetical protein
MFERRRLRKAFGSYLRPESIEKILRAGKAGPQQPVVAHFQYVVLLLDDSRLEDVPALIATAVSTLINHKATVLNTPSSLVIGLLGVPHPEGGSPQERAALVGAILHELGDRARIAHGECDGPVGDFGGPKRLTYGALIPGFSKILKSLLESVPGAAIEISG